MALDKVLFSKYKSVGIIADDRDSAELIFRDKVKFAYDNLPSWIHDTFQVKTDRKGELVFENNHCSIAVDTSFRWGTLNHSTYLSTERYVTSIQIKRGKYKQVH